MEVDSEPSLERFEHVEEVNAKGAPGREGSRSKRWMFPALCREWPGVYCWGVEGGKRGSDCIQEILDLQSESCVSYFIRSKIYQTEIICQLEI